MLTGQFLKQQAGIVGTIFIILSWFRIGKRCQHAMAQDIQLKKIEMKRSKPHKNHRDPKPILVNDVFDSDAQDTEYNQQHHIPLCFLSTERGTKPRSKKNTLNLSHTLQRLDWLMTPEEEERNRKSFILRMTLGWARYKCTKNCAVNHLDHLGKKTQGKCENS